METSDRLIRTVRRQLRWTLTLRDAMGLATIYLFAWGIAVVAARSLVPVERHWLAWGAVGVAVAAMAGVIRASRRVPDERTIRAVCDRQQRGGGLVMSEGEVELGDWEARRRVAPLQIQWRSGRQGGLLVVGLAFVALAFAAPDSPAAPQREAGQVQLADNVQAIEEKLDLLAEEEAVDPDQADELRETLRELRETARDDAMRAWEMLDHAEKQLAQAAEEAAERAVAETASLAEVAALAEALAQDQSSDLPRLDALAASEVLDELAQMLDNLDAELAQSLADALADAEIDLDAEALRELADRLREAEADSDALDGEACDMLTQLAGLCENAGTGNGDRIMRMIEARLIDPEWAEACEAAGACDGEALMLALAIGAGEAPMSFSEEPISTEDASSEPVALRPSAIDRDQSALVGLSSAAPEEDLPAERSGVSALQDAATGGGSAASQVVLPRHRGAVQRYFEREAGTPE